MNFESLDDLKKYVEKDANSCIHWIEENKITFDYFRQYPHVITLIESIKFDCVIKLLKVLTYTFISIEEFKQKGE